ncbi:SurA N-terminal domain-containing protein [Thiogranum longum]
MRDKALGWLGWIVIGLIIITFALFGLGSYLQDKTRVFAAKVNDAEIAPGELQQAYQQQRSQLEQMLGEAYNPALIDDEALKRRALDTLIQRQLVLQEAEANGLLISDQLLAARIHAIPAFQEDGKFSEERYQRLLLQQGQNVAGFEYQTRQLLQAEQLVNGISQTDFVTPTELERAYRLQEQKRDFSFLIVTAESFEDTVELSDEEIRAYYDQHPEEFMNPERARLAYLRITGEELSKGIEIDEAEVDAYYREKKESLKTQEQRRASHILIQVAADADEEALKKATAEAEDVLAKIREGGDFAALAKEHSDDPGSAAQGGDLGFFARGAMVPEFEDAVFSMETGDVSDPVKTQFGFHIIKLTEIRASGIPELEDARAELVAELQKRQVDDLFYEQLEQLTDLSYEHPDSLDAAAEALGLEVQTSDWVTAAGGAGIGAYPKVVAAAFSADVLEAGNNSEPVEVAANDVIVVRVQEREAAQQAPLESVRERIVEALKQQQAAELAKARGEELLEQLKQGAAMEALTEQDKLELKTAEAVTRSAEDYNPDVLREAFRLPRPSEGASIDTGLALGNGDYAILRLTRVIDADPASMKDDVRTGLESGYENMRRSLLMSAMVDDLRARAEIVIPEQAE